MLANFFGIDLAVIALVAAAVGFGIRVENFPPNTAAGEADSIIGAEDRGEIENGTPMAKWIGGFLNPVPITRGFTRWSKT